MKKERLLSFEAACAQYVHRYTMDHVPAWALKPAPNGKFYAPQYVSDREWYAKTSFAGESPMASKRHCFSTGQSWPLGHWLHARPNVALFKQMTVRS